MKMFDSIRRQVAYTALLAPVVFHLLPCTSLAQDIHFSQFYEAPMLRNPALTGIFEGDYRASVIYRNQWASISAPFQTALLHAEARKPVRTTGDKADFISGGIAAWYDKAGSVGLTNTSAYGTVAYNKSLSAETRSFLTFGFTAGYLQRSFDAGRSTWSNQWNGASYDPTRPSGETFTNSRMNAFDLGAGISYAGAVDGTGEGEDVTTYYFGVGAYHLTEPKQSFVSTDEDSRLRRKYTANAGTAFQLSELVRLQLHGNFAAQGSAYEVMAGGLVGWQRPGPRSQPPLGILGGVFYRYRDAVVPVVKVQWKALAIGASYDVNLSKLRAASNSLGGLELSLIHTGLFKTPLSEQSRTQCPTF
jgi:type IX secretion system PorP/SprF family membrane protein